jgi:hypothetical protein
MPRQSKTFPLALLPKVSGLELEQVPLGERIVTLRVQLVFDEDLPIISFLSPFNKAIGEMWYLLLT